MALTHITTVRNALADLVVDLLDVGAGTEGDLQIGTTAFAAILATILFQEPAFGAAVGGTATMAGAPLEDASAAGGGNAAVFRCRDENDAEVFQGTVTITAGGGDMELSSLLINNGDAVRINSFTYSASA